MRISTALQVKNAKTGVHNVTGAVGLYLKVGDAGASYFYRYRHGGNRRSMGLGSREAIGLAEAKEAARKAAALVREGVDPIEERSARRAAELAKPKPVTFAEAAETDFKAHELAWKNPRTIKLWRARFEKYVYPVFGASDVNAIEPTDIAEVMNAAVAGGAPKVAQRLRVRLRSVFAGCIVRKERDRALGNPAEAGEIKTIFHMPRAEGEDPHFRRIEDIDDAPEVFRQIVAKAELLSSAALDAWAMMILTAARPSEALGMRWSWVDLEKSICTFPAKQTKTSREHRVPLSSLARKILERRMKVGVPPDGDSLVFTGRGGGAVSYSAFQHAPKLAGIDARSSPHAWRSVFRDWAASKKKGNVSYDLAEMVLGHALGAVARAYRRGDGLGDRVEVMERYANWLSPAGAKVVSLSVARMKA